MTFYVRAPGTCGEFLQGSIDGRRFLVTCPINRFSYALSGVRHPLRANRFSLQPKALAAKCRVTELYGKRSGHRMSLEETSTGTHVYLHSQIPQGKGMASSSADIAAVAMATSLVNGPPLTMKELERIALSIEPSDAAFYPSVVQFDYIEGRISRLLGPCPPMKILIFDEGGEVDTVSFNSQADLTERIAEKEDLIREALFVFERGMEQKNISLIGQAATLSAFANQRILYKPHLYDFHEIGQAYGSVGTVIAHSGTIMGLLFPHDFRVIEDCKNDIRARIPSLSYVDTVETCSEGLTYVKR